MKVGITGTSKGATEAQLTSLRELLIELRASELHHGDCVGADEQAHAVAQELGLVIVLHPPDDPKARAFCQGGLSWVEKPYLKRNQDIVNETRVLIALPRTAREELRSGTWSTVRYARKRGRDVRVLL